jgi:predicted transposase YbfD/YdcC
VRFPVGLITISLLCAMAAERKSQQSCALWLSVHWTWLVLAWEDWTHSRLPEVARRRAPSQATLSRFLKLFAWKSLVELFTSYQRTTLRTRWRAFCARRRMDGAKRKGGKVRDRRKLARLARKPLPQYALDGKRRNGCVSPETGRHEVDLRLYCPDTDQILASRTLNDKEGEQDASREILEHEGRALPKGLITGDAGILSPQVVDAARESKHEYLFGIKGNAGKVFETIKGHHWERIEKSHEHYSKGHGRQEFRSLKRCSVLSLGRPEQFEKYKDVGFVCQLTRLVKTNKTGALTEEVAYFVASRGLADFSYPQIQAYVRDHWKQEAFHWVRDVVLGEDDCPQKENNASRVLSVLRDAVIDAGMRVFGSTRRFLDAFSADPRGTLKR